MAPKLWAPLLRWNLWQPRTGAHQSLRRWQLWACAPLLRWNLRQPRTGAHQSLRRWHLHRLQYRHRLTQPHSRWQLGGGRGSVREEFVLFRFLSWSYPTDMRHA